MMRFRGLTAALAALCLFAVLIASPRPAEAQTAATYQLTDSANTVHQVHGFQCLSTLLCLAQVPIDFTGSPFGVSGNPFYVEFPSAQHFICDSGCAGGGGGGLSVAFGGAIGANGTPGGFKDSSGNFQANLGDVTNGQWVLIKNSSLPVTGTFWPYTLGQQVAGSSVPVVLTAAQLATLTPPAAITGYALETGGNLAQIVTDFGAPGATACTTDTASCNQNQQLQRLAQRLTSIVTALGSPFQAGGSIGNTSFGATLAASSIQAAAALDGWNVTMGAKADAVCGTATGTCSELALLKYIASASQQAPPLTVNGSPASWTGLTPGVAQTGTIVAANTDKTSVGGTAIGAMANFGTTPGAVKGEGVNASVFLGTTAPSTGSGASGSGTQRVTPANDTAAGVSPVKSSVPVVSGGNIWNTTAASLTAVKLSSTSGGTTGTTGDYLSHCVITPTSTSPGAVQVFDGTNTAANDVINFAGGASSVSNLVPFSVPVGSLSINGAWEITTGANVSVSCYGKFT